MTVILAKKLHVEFDRLADVLQSVLGYLEADRGLFVDVTWQELSVVFPDQIAVHVKLVEAHLDVDLFV